MAKKIAAENTGRGALFIHFCRLIFSCMEFAFIMGREITVLMAIQKYACHNNRNFSGEPGIISNGMVKRLNVKSNMGRKGALTNKDNTVRMIHGDNAVKKVIRFTTIRSDSSILFRSTSGL